MAFSTLLLMLWSIITTPAPATATQLPRDDDKPGQACGFSGNSDLYGLGIRLGIYMQWVSSLIVFSWYPEGRASLDETYTIFLFAVVVVIVVQTAQTAPTYAVEIVVLTYICFGGAWAVLITGVRDRYRGRSDVRRRSARYAFTLAILVAGAFYCCWFWGRGVRNRDNFRETPCGTYMFFFARVPFYNPSLLRFLLALSIYVAIFWGLGIVVGLTFAMMPDVLVSRAEWLQSAREIARDQLLGWGESHSRPQSLASNAGLDDDDDGDGTFGLVFSSISATYSVIAIELTLHWNSVRDVYTLNTTGQLLPFIIGLVGLCKCIYKSVIDRIRRKRNRRQSAEPEAIEMRNTGGGPSHTVITPTNEA